MMRNIIHIIILLLSATAVLSCSPLPDQEMSPSDYDNMGNWPEGSESDSADGLYKLVISGGASDKDTSAPLEEIKITLTASEMVSATKERTLTKTAYTDNKGGFTLNIGGFQGHISCTIKAEDPNGIYGTGTHELPLITWDSYYNMEGNTFYVNNIDFYLKKVE